jgi:hypothetical protein
VLIIALQVVSYWQHLRYGYYDKIRYEAKSFGCLTPLKAIYSLLPSTFPGEKYFSDTAVQQPRTRYGYCRRAFMPGGDPLYPLLRRIISPCSASHQIISITPIMSCQHPVV